MRASKFLFKLGIMTTCCIVLAVLFMSVGSEPVSAYQDNDWNLAVNPNRVEIVIGESYDIAYWSWWIYPDETENAIIEVYYYQLNAPDGITTTPAPDDQGEIWWGYGNRAVAYTFEIHIAPDFPSEDEQRLDFFFKIRWHDGTVNYKTVSMYVLPRDVIRWEVASYSPTYASMSENENQTILLKIQNSYTDTLNFDINTRSLNPGFSLSPLSVSVAIDAGEYYEWATTLTCTGYALNPDSDYLAVTLGVTNIESGTYRLGGQTVVKYIGEAVENVADLEIWWSENIIEIPFAGTENVDLVIKNIGSQNLKLDTGFLSITFSAHYWVYDQGDVTLPVSLAPGENLTVQYAFHALGDPETLLMSTGCTARVTDNFGNVREAYIEMKAIVGTFSVKIRPLVISLQRGYSEHVYIRITNNEDANRNYIIDSMELRAAGIDWATSNPQTENVEIIAFGSREIRFEITVLSGREGGIRSFDYYVRCEQTQKNARVTVAVEITVPIIPIQPGVGGLLALFAPFTGGDLVAAGYLCSLFLIIMPCTITGLAISRGKPGLTVSIFGFIGIIMSMALGLIPSWIFIFILFVIALYLSRGSIWGRGGG